MSNISNTSTYTVFFPKNFFLAWCHGFLAVGSLIVVVNLATILTFAINSHLRRRSAYCLINLAAADMFHGLLLITESLIVIGEYTGFINDLIYRGIMYIVLNITTTLSLFSLVPVSLERVYATFFPFSHRTTRLRSYFIVFFIIWVFSISIVIAHYFILTSELNIFSFFLVYSLFFLCLLIISISYTAVFIQVKIQAKQVQTDQQHRTAEQIRQKREQQLAITLFILTALSLATWMPLVVGHFTEEIASIRISYTVRFSFLLIQHTNSLINPIIYVFKMRDFRKALMRMILRCSREQRQIRPIGNHGNNLGKRQPRAPIDSS